MKTRSKRIVFACLVSLLFAIAWMSWAAAPAPPRVPKEWKFTLPDGDASAGKAVFLSMKCYSCHALDIPGEKFPPARSKGAGPDLTGYSALPKEYVADSIIRPHTVVAAPGYIVKEGRVTMGEYNHFLTVQELIDIVALLRQGAKTTAK